MTNLRQFVVGETMFTTGQLAQTFHEPSSYLWRFRFLTVCEWILSRLLAPSKFLHNLKVTSWRVCRGAFGGGFLWVQWLQLSQDLLYILLNLQLSKWLVIFPESNGGGHLLRGLQFRPCKSNPHHIWRADIRKSTGTPCYMLLVCWRGRTLNPITNFMNWSSSFDSKKSVMICGLQSRHATNHKPNCIFSSSCPFLPLNIHAHQEKAYWKITLLHTL